MRNPPSSIIEMDIFGSASVLVWDGIVLGNHTNLHIFQEDSVSSTHYCDEILLTHMRLFRDTEGLDFLFMDDIAPRHHTDTVEGILESECIQCINWLARSLRLSPIEHMWNYLCRYLTSCDKGPAKILGLKVHYKNNGTLCLTSF